MKRLDLIISALDRVDTFDWNQQDNKLIKDARIAARELRELEPTNEFKPDWDTLQPYHDRIAELEAQIALYKKADNARELGLDYEPEQEPVDIHCPSCLHSFSVVPCSKAQPEQEPVKKALRLKPHECICGYSVGHPLVPKCICKPEYTAAPKRDVDTNQQNVNTSEERVQISDKSIHERKYPNHETYCGRCGACTYKPWVGLTDDECDEIWGDCLGIWDCLKMTEAKLRSKNET